MSLSRVLLNVTADLIARGIRQSCERCPIALAAFEQIPGCVVVEVSHRWIAIGVMMDDRRQTLRARLPELAEYFVAVMDHGGRPRPQTFVLNFEPSDPTA